MSGYTTYLRWQRIESYADALGFRIGNPRHGNWSGTNDVDVVSLYPKDTELPTYSRDAELFVGTFGQLEIWLQGWVKAQQYDMLLRLTDHKKRKKAEVREIERQRLQALKIEQKQVWNTLKEKTNV